MQTLTLTVGQVYRFTHARKGIFEARFLGMEPTGEGDPEPHFLHVEIDTGEGSPYAWMANVKQYIQGRKTTPLVTPKLLRPSLITHIEEV